MLGEDQSVTWLDPLEDLDCFLGEAEARHQIRHVSQAPAEHLGAFFLAVGLIDHAQHRGGVGVIDKFVRQEGVQHDLDRRIWCRRINEIGALDRDEFFVADVIERAQPPQCVEPDGGQAFGLDRRHVGAGSFYAQDIELLAEVIDLRLQ